MQNTIIALLEQMAIALGSEFKVSFVFILINKVIIYTEITIQILIMLQVYLPQIVPQILKTFIHDNSHNQVVTNKV